MRGDVDFDSGQATRRGLADHVGAVARNWWVIALSSLLGGLVSLAVCLVQDPVYEASSTLYVTSGSEGDSASAAYQGSMASQQRVASYADLVSSDSIVGMALENSGLEMTLEEAKALLSASAKLDTVLLTLSARGPNPEEAARLSNGAAEAMSSYVAELETPAGGRQPLAKLTVVSPATPEDTPVEPRTKRTVALGLALGAFIGVLLVSFREVFDSRVRSLADYSGLVDAPVLGQIPEESGLAAGQIVDFGIGATPAAESYRQLRTNLAFVNVDAPVQAVVVTSAQEGEGKTTTAINLAASLAEAGRSVVLVDGDLRKPSASARVAPNRSVGLSNVIRGDTDLLDAIQQTGQPGLDVLASGSSAPNPAELLGTERCRELFGRLKANYEFIIIDTPPVLPVTDAAVVSQNADGVLLVSRVNRSKRQDLTRAAQHLASVNASVVGLVLNGAAGSSGGYRYTYGTEATADLAYRGRI